MDVELKAKWVAALRSGKYQQTRGALKDRDGYCCLGVLCQVAGVPIVGDNDVLGGGNSPETAYAPLLKLIGAKNPYELTARNDGGSSGSSGSVLHRRHSFSEIADYIEREL